MPKNYKKILHLSIVKFVFFIFFLTFLATNCSVTHKKDISFKNKKIKYTGRIAEKDSCREIYWSASSITIKFDGRIVAAVLKDETGNNYFNVIIDGKVESVLQPDTVKKIYVLTPMLNNGVHTVTLYKRSEARNGKTMFYGLQLEKGAELLKVKEKNKLIEFYGNSITTGYAVEDTTGNDSAEGTNTNSYYSYAAITARHFNADLHCIAWSGIGITVSWFPKVMKEIYYRLNPTDSNSYWDFSKVTPDIVVVNLLQNDSWLVNMPENEEYKKRFGNKIPTDDFIIASYKNFILKLRKHYPEVKIICMLGNMDITKKKSKWINIVNKAVSSLNDKNIFTLFVPYKNTKGHPDITEQNILADSLITFIESRFGW